MVCLFRNLCPGSEEDYYSFNCLIAIEVGDDEYIYIKVFQNQIHQYEEVSVTWDGDTFEEKENKLKLKYAKIFGKKVNVSYQVTEDENKLISISLV